MSFFPREKEEKSSFCKVLSLRAMGIPGAAGAPSNAGSSPGACQPPNQPSSQEGVRTSLSLAKVLWLTSKLSVTEGRGGQRESQTLGKVKTSGRRERENEQGDAPVAEVGVGEAPPYVEWEMPAGSWRSEAPQHHHTLWLRSPTGEPRSSELPERLPRDPRGDTEGTRWGHTEHTCFGKSRRTSSNNLKLDIYI